ncbi:probable F-box protein [Tanacetum coccineum]|uniref:Probable F-box protein n=1 Tax=Tanacetum coccineum TaxID=301880 RepID=A0ABQ5IL86_9ASTR
MAAINHVSCFMCSSSLSSSSSSRRDVSIASIQFPKIHTNSLINTTNIQKIQPNTGLVEEMDFERISPKSQNKNPKVSPDVLEKLYTILEAVSDRLDMHKNIGEQRNNCDNLLLTSINTITLSAVTATGMLIIMNKIQPSQLIEEQRNASRLFKQYEETRLDNLKAKIQGPLQSLENCYCDILAISSSSSPFFCNS